MSNIYETTTDKLKALVVLSGGLDSTTALYLAKKEYKEVSAISFDYNQKHSKELEYAKKTCEKLDISHYIQKITIPDTRSSLTSDEQVPYGHYEAESMAKTVVNNRNAIMFSFATALAIDKGINCILVGIHKGDNAIYPDCREEFFDKFVIAMKLANEGFLPDFFSIEAPFIRSSKADIAELALLLEVPIENTYSDYEGGEVQNAQSGTSVERIEAISEAYFRLDKLIEPYTNAQSKDPTIYTNKQYALNLLINKKKQERLKQILSSLEY